MYSLNLLQAQILDGFSAEVEVVGWVNARAFLFILFFHNLKQYPINIPALFPNKFTLQHLSLKKGVWTFSVNRLHQFLMQKLYGSAEGCSLVDQFTLILLNCSFTRSWQWGLGSTSTAVHLSGDHIIMVDGILNLCCNHFTVTKFINPARRTKLFPRLIQEDCNL